MLRIARITVGLFLFALALPGQNALKFEVDPTWPKPLPDKWITGQVGGVCTDSHDHVVIVNRRNNFWVGGNDHGIIQKYSHDGKLLLQIGTRGKFDTSDGTAKGKPLNASH